MSQALCIEYYTIVLELQIWRMYIHVLLMLHLQVIGLHGACLTVPVF